MRYELGTLGYAKTGKCIEFIEGTMESGSVDNVQNNLQNYKNLYQNVDINLTLYRVCFPLC